MFELIILFCILNKKNKIKKRKYKSDIIKNNPMLLLIIKLLKK